MVTPFKKLRLKFNFEISRHYDVLGHFTKLQEF